MPTALAIKGLVVGLVVSAPLGPVGVLCIRRSLERGWGAGWVTGLGAASADVLCAGAAGFGMDSISGLLLAAQPWPGLVGGAVVLLMGLALCLKAPVLAAASAPTDSGPVSWFVSALAVTLLNPLTSLSILAIFSGLGVGVVTGGSETVCFVAGLAAGAALWWHLLSRAAAALSSRLTAERLRSVNRICGLVLVALGAHLVVAAWW